MPEANEYFENFDVNDWSYDGFQTFMTAEKCSETIWINSLRAISQSDNFPVRCRRKASHILNSYSVTVVIPSKQSTAIFKLWYSLRKKVEDDRFIKEYILDINRLSNLLQKNEIRFLCNLFPPVNVELDKEVNEHLDDIFSIFNSKETLNAESIFEEVEQKRKLANLGIKTSKECQITFIFKILESCIDILTDIDGSYTSWNPASIPSNNNNLQNSQEFVNGTRPDFTVQNELNYEIFTLKVVGSSTNKIQKKVNNDFAKLSKQMRNNINYIVAQEEKKGRLLPKDFQIFGALTEGFDIVIKRMISIDRYVIMQEIFTIEVPSSITDYYKLKILIGRMIALS
ncbi:17947_t:CDS:2, partial [Cetraspora pellucida]